GEGGGGEGDEDVRGGGRHDAAEAAARLAVAPAVLDERARDVDGEVRLAPRVEASAGRVFHPAGPPRGTALHRRRDRRGRKQTDAAGLAPGVVVALECGEELDH